MQIIKLPKNVGKNPKTLKGYNSGGLGILVAVKLNGKIYQSRLSRISKNKRWGPGKFITVIKGAKYIFKSKGPVTFVTLYKIKKSKKTIKKKKSKKAVKRKKVITRRRRTVGGSKRVSTTRKSPEKSATLYSVGTVKKGNDGNFWVIKKTSNGVKRWVKN